MRVKPRYFFATNFAELLCDQIHAQTRSSPVLMFHADRTFHAERLQKRRSQYTKDYKKMREISKKRKKMGN